MNCTSCGAPLRDGAKFCTSCGRAIEQPTRAEQAPFSDDDIVLHDSKKKSGKKGSGRPSGKKKRRVPVLLILLALAAVVALRWQIVGLFCRTVFSDERYYHLAEKWSADDFCKGVGAVYRLAGGYEEDDQGNSGRALTIEAEHADGTLDWMESLKIDARTQHAGGIRVTEADVELNGEKVFPIRYSSAGALKALQLGALSENYMALPQRTDALSQFFDAARTANISRRQLEAILADCMTEITNGLTPETVERGQLSAAAVKQPCTIMTFTLTEEDIAGVSDRFSKALRNTGFGRELLAALAENTGMEEDEALQALVDELFGSVVGDSTAQMTVYIADNCHIIGRELTLPDGREFYYARTLRLTQRKAGLVARLVDKRGETFKADGTMRLTSGTISVTHIGGEGKEKVLELDYSNLQGLFRPKSGHIKLSFGKGLGSIRSRLPLSRLAGVKLSGSFVRTDDNYTGDFDLSYQGDPMMTLRAEYKLIDAEAFEYVDEAPSIAEWTSSLRMTKVMSAVTKTLKASGIPQKVASVLVQILLQALAESA